MDDDLISVQDAAQILGVTSTVVYRLVKREDLTVAREEWRGLQRRRLFRRGDVEALKARRERERTA